MSETGWRAAGPQRFGEATFYTVAALLAFGTYFLVFRLTAEGTVVDDALASARNFIPLALLTVVARGLLLRHVVHRAAVQQLGAHLVLGAAFAGLWYWLLMVMIGVSSGDGMTRFRVEPFFDDPAFAWQMLQGAAVYAMLASIIARRAHEVKAELHPAIDDSARAPASIAPAADKERSLDRYFIRKGEDILPVDVDAIVSIEGADDYAEVQAGTERHLVRLTLAELERSLDADRFIRVHRSRIVNLKRIERAEPAGGGRMLLHMENGAVVQTSRAGTRLLRERVV